MEMSRDVESGDMSGELSSSSDFTEECARGARLAEVGNGDLANKIAENENKAVGRSRFFMLLVLAVAAVAAAAMSFTFTHMAEHEDFHTGFESLVGEINSMTNQNADNIVNAFHQFGVSVTSFALKTKSTFPMVTVPDFERRIAALTKIANLLGVLYLPVIRDMQTRSIYEQYVALNGLDALQESQIAGNQTINTGGYIPFLFELVGFENDPTFQNVSISQAGSNGPWMPIYQLSPPSTSAFGVNWDIGVFDWNKRDLIVMEETRAPVITEVFDLNFLLAEELRTTHPTSIYHEPIMTDFSNNAKVGAVLQASFPWNIFFENVLAEGTPSVFAVIRNSCNQSFTYEIMGRDAVYRGEGELQEKSYDYMKETVVLESFQAREGLEMCAYSIDLYPSSSLDDSYQTNSKWLISGIILLTFFFTTITIVVYDFTVSKRQAKVMQSASKTNAIIDSFFPSQFRERLFGEEDPDEKEGSGDWRNNRNTKKFTKASSVASREKQLDDADIPELSMKKPVAEYYENTTIMMADIHGFTAWSSAREPSQVFMLLETIYGAFDRLAQRRNVFKVETVGDCYVAVAGLPKPRADHAIVMSRFSYDCMTKMSQVVHKLEVVLGPGTSSLGVRIGLHSGPTIAGVLRGEKARFQLFGDTINTASRVETTGTPNRIHISQATADELSKSGKGHWIVPREDTVFAKGKGEMQTFWLQAHHSGSTARTPVSLEYQQPTETEEVTLTEYSADEPDVVLRRDVSRSFLEEKSKGLVEFSVSLLVPHLERITALRAAQGKPRVPSARLSEKLAELASTIGRQGDALYQIKDFIELPQANPAIDDEVTDQTLSHDIEEQLRSYLSQIASTYRENAFHNFTHAVSVAQCASKLLSRIVAPGVVNIVTGETQHDLKGDQELHDHTLGLASAPLTQFAIIFSAIIHDADHRGVPNNQLASEEPSMASAYRQSIAEQHSIDIAWSLLMKDEFEKLRGAIYSDEEELGHFRSVLVNSTMATDIFDKSLANARRNRWDAAFAEQVHGEESNNRKATIVIEHILQAADVSHCMQHWNMYQKWNEKLFAERIEAFKQGRAKQDPADGWYEGELSFFDNYVIPLANKLESCGVFGVSCVEFMSYAKQNREEWDKKGRMVVDELAKKYS